MQLTTGGFANINKVGSGKVAINGYNMPDSLGTVGQVLASDGANTVDFVTLDDYILLDDLSVIGNAAASGAGTISYNNTNGQFQYTPPTAGGIGAAVLTDLSVTTAAAGSAALSYNDSTGVFTYTPPDLSSYLTSETFTSLVQDTTPQLGGNLDLNNFDIVTTTNGDVDILPNGNGNVNITTDAGGINLSSLKSYDELLKTDNSTTGTISLDHEAAPLHYIVQTGNLTISGLTTPTSGANVTLILNNSGGSYTLSFSETNSTFYAVDGTNPTLTGFDMFNILCLDDTADAEVYIVTGVGSISAIT